ncbi:MAG: DUF424 family protein, partial [Candidatus Aenigmatarchaeota archaeon]
IKLHSKFCFAGRFMAEFFVNRFERNGDIVVAACDSNIVGQVFEENKLRLSVSKTFYCGRECSEQELLSEMRNSTIINLAGNLCVAVAIKNGFVGKNHVLSIGGVMHAQAVTAKIG